MSTTTSPTASPDPDFWDWVDGVLDKIEEYDPYSGYIFGFTPNLRLALIISGNRATLIRYGVVNGLGRWECSRRHLHRNANTYTERFPIRPWQVAVDDTPYAICENGAALVPDVVHLDVHGVADEVLFVHGTTGRQCSGECGDTFRLERLHGPTVLVLPDRNEDLR